MMMRNNNKPTLKKTRTFLLTKSDSMQLPAAYYEPMEHVPKRSASLRFPTSPQLVSGEEMLHFSHPQHPLSQVNLPDLFTCAGCKEYGAGKRFTCQQCDYQLHDFCALAPPALKSHPFHCQHQLLFYSRPGTNLIYQLHFIFIFMLGFQVFIFKQLSTRSMHISTRLTRAHHLFKESAHILFMVSIQCSLMMISFILYVPLQR